MVSVAAVASSFNPATSAATSRDAVASEPLKVVVLPSRAYAAEVRMLSTEVSEEWSAAARANLAAAVDETVDQSPSFVPVALPELSAEQHAAIDEFVAVANLASTRFDGWTWFGGPTVKRGAVDRELGPSLAFLRERTGAHYAIGAFGYQQEQSKGVATT
jgi:hypothetical protein